MQPGEVTPILQPDAGNVRSGSTAKRCCRICWLISVSFFVVSIFVLMKLLLPVYNKFLFNGSGSSQGFHFPISSTVVQIVFVVIFLTALFTLMRFLQCVIPSAIQSRASRFFQRCCASADLEETAVDETSFVPSNPPPSRAHVRRRTGSSALPVRLVTTSVNADAPDVPVEGHPSRRSFCSRLIRSPTVTLLLQMCPVSFCFAFVLILTNIGIDKVNVNVHVLLKTTNMLWVLMLSFFISERPTLWELFMAIFIGSGAVLLSLDVSFGWTLGTENVVGMVVNLFAPLAEAFTVIALKKVIVARRKEVGIVPITLLQLGMAGLFMLIPALVVETALTRPSFWTAIAFDATRLGPVLLGGSLITLVFHLSQVALTKLESVLTQAIVGQLIILPQLIIYNSVAKYLPANWRLKAFEWSTFHIIGAVAISIGTTGAGIWNVILKVRRVNIKKNKKANRGSSRSKSKKRGCWSRWGWLLVGEEWREDDLPWWRRPAAVSFASSSEDQYSDSVRSS